MGWRKSDTPSTLASSGWSRRMTSEALILRWASGLRLIWMRPLFSVVLVPSTPINEERLSTASSFRMTTARSRCRWAMAAVESDDRVKSIFRLAIKPAFFFLFVKTQELGAHHGGESEGDKSGNEDSNSKGDGKFTEEAADDIAHEKKRDEHGDER